MNSRNYDSDVAAFCTMGLLITAVAIFRSMLNFS